MGAGGGGPAAGSMSQSAGRPRSGASWGRGLDLITVAEAAGLLGVTEAEVVQLTADGVLTRYQRGREVLVDRAEVEGPR